MPEIWLTYGDVQVALDIRAENLFKVLEGEGKSLSEEEIQEELRGLELKGRCAILLAYPSRQDFLVLTQLLPILESKGFPRSECVIFTRRDFVRTVRKRSDELSLKVSEIRRSSDSQEIFEGQSDFETTLFVSNTGFDPLFGFSGGPVGFSRLTESSAIGEAFFSEEPSMPAPGEKTNSAKFLQDKLAGYSEVQSIQFTPHMESLSNIFVGPLFECHRRASEALLQSNRITGEEKLKASIVSPGMLLQSTFSSALKALWNSIGSVREKGTIAIVAESSEGFGSEALRLHSLGRLQLKDRIKNERYVDGLEEVVFLRNVQEKYSTLLVSSLPNYYVENQFQFSPVRKVGDTLKRVVDKYGQRTKLFVIPHASGILIK